MGAVIYALAYNIFPVFASSIYAATIIGSSASVMAIAVATATLVPDYSMNLMFIGSVKLKYLLIAYIVFDLISIASQNPGGSFAHLGGALLGFVYIKVLQGGNDLSGWFERKPTLKVVKNDRPNQTNRNKSSKVNQKEVDAVLDKVSKSGYDKLSKEEKEILFKASKD